MRKGFSGLTASIGKRGVSVDIGREILVSPGSLVSLDIATNTDPVVSTLALGVYTVLALGSRGSLGASIKEKGRTVKDRKVTALTLAVTATEKGPPRRVRRLRGSGFGANRVEEFTGTFGVTGAATGCRVRMCMDVPSTRSTHTQTSNMVGRQHFMMQRVLSIYSLNHFYLL